MVKRRTNNFINFGPMGSAVFVFILFINLRSSFCAPDIGFQGMRGKRSDSVENSAQKDLNQDTSVNFESSRWPPQVDLTSSDESNLKYLDPAPDNTLQLQDLSPYYNKRAPMGFQGMRGKKLFYYPYRFIPKRAMSGFMAMRGKKDDFEAEKRKISGFMGVRGKKDFQSNLEPYVSNGLNFEDELRLYELLANERNVAGLMRSLPPTGYGFNDDLIEKRAPNGFVGMRGKKSVDNRNYFIGLSKGEIEDSKSEMKRGPIGFVAVKGKKNPFGSGFFGSRGKKGPYSELRSRFIGVRGKKDFEVTQDVVQNETVDDLNKRKPSGFLGMRGKKENPTAPTED